jgi:hypothetical protein
MSAFPVAGAASAPIAPAPSNNEQANAYSEVMSGGEAAVQAPQIVWGKSDQAARVWSDLGRLSSVARSPDVNSPGVAKYAGYIQSLIVRLSTKIEANENKLLYYRNELDGFGKDLTPEARRQLTFEAHSLQQTIAYDRSALSKCVQEGEALLNQHRGLLK